MHIRHLHICPSHVLISFLNTSNVSADLILTGREFQMFGPRKARLFVLNSGRNTTRLFWCCVRFDLKVSDFLKRFFIAWIRPFTVLCISARRYQVFEEAF